VREKKNIYIHHGLNNINNCLFHDMSTCTRFKIKGTVFPCSVYFLFHVRCSYSLSPSRLGLQTLCLSHQMLIFQNIHVGIGNAQSIDLYAMVILILWLPNSRSSIEILASLKTSLAFLLNFIIRSILSYSLYFGYLY